MMPNNKESVVKQSKKARFKNPITAQDILSIAKASTRQGDRTRGAGNPCLVVWQPASQPDELTPSPWLPQTEASPYLSLLSEKSPAQPAAVAPRMGLDWWKVILPTRNYQTLKSRSLVLTTVQNFAGESERDPRASFHW